MAPSGFGRGLLLKGKATSRILLTRLPSSLTILLPHNALAAHQINSNHVDTLQRRQHTHTIMEASAQHNTLEIIQNYVQDPAIENQAPLKTIKMEDISSSTTSSPSLHNTPKANSTTKSSESKPAKKRKSWGQVLPEPKTNLPPRKVHDYWSQINLDGINNYSSAPKLKMRKNSDELNA